MKLYKCVSFASSYWPYIAQERKIRFATIDELLSGNDKEEFNHRWQTKSRFLGENAHFLKPRYELLFSKTVILSFGMSPNKKCWEVYCGKGGVRYEFELSEEVLKESDVSNRTVSYDDSKTFNLPDYLIRLEKNSDIKSLLKKETELSHLDKMQLLCWLNTGIPSETTLNHVTDEIVFKKECKYAFEDEFRLVHLTSPIGNDALKVQLHEQKIDLSSLGLNLINISTSDINEVRQRIGDPSISVSEISF
ncbi:MAG: hypothetical protein AABY64_14330 [Bdellovibrionota bacterium]